MLTSAATPSVACERSSRLRARIAAFSSTLPIEPLLATARNPTCRCWKRRGSKVSSPWVARSNGESKPPNPENEATCRMAKKMKTDRAKKHYRKRKYLAEPPFAWIKSVMRFDRFSLRGVAKVTSEWDLACLAANLKRMHGKLARA